MPTKVFPFEQLPAELRNMVYAYAPSTNSTVRIHHRRPAGSRKHVLRATTEVTRKYSRSTKTTAFLPNNGTAILRLNKQIYKEAFPLL